MTRPAWTAILETVASRRRSSSCWTIDLLFAVTRAMDSDMQPTSNTTPKTALRQTIGLLLVGAAGLGVLGCGQREPPKARFVRQIPWIGRGQWLKGELHNHTKFSDSSHSVVEVVDQAARFGCDVLAITDHADRNLKAATPEQERSIQAARASHPAMLILAGLEWNMPPWGGDEHVNVFVPPGPEEWQNLAALKEQFDDLGRKPHDAALAERGLRWLAERYSAGDVPPVVIDNHPSRLRAKSMELVADFRHWRNVNGLMIGFEGAPGHQRRNSPGDYRFKETTIDRWDPAVARVGDAWDTLLAEGVDAWAALASADLHNGAPTARYDYWPGEFAETWLYVPEKTSAGVLTALRAGAFFACHGHIVREAELLVEADGLPRPAYPGEAIEVWPGMGIRASLRLRIPAKDWEGKPNQIDTIELIGVTREGARVAASRVPEPAETILVDRMEVPAGGIVLRARGRHAAADGSGLMFYTNPVRVMLREP